MTRSFTITNMIHENYAWTKSTEISLIKNKKYIRKIMFKSKKNISIIRNLNYYYNFFFN